MAKHQKNTIIDGNWVETRLEKLCQELACYKIRSAEVECAGCPIYSSKLASMFYPSIEITSLWDVEEVDYEPEVREASRKNRETGDFTIK